MLTASRQAALVAALAMAAAALPGCVAGDAVPLTDVGPDATLIPSPTAERDGYAAQAVPGFDIVGSWTAAPRADVDASLDLPLPEPSEEPVLLRIGYQHNAWSVAWLQPQNDRLRVAADHTDLERVELSRPSAAAVRREVEARVGVLLSGANGRSEAPTCAGDRAGLTGQVSAGTALLWCLGDLAPGGGIRLPVVVDSSLPLYAQTTDGLEPGQPGWCPSTSCTEDRPATAPVPIDLLERLNTELEEAGGFILQPRSPTLLVATVASGETARLAVSAPSLTRALTAVLVMADLAAAVASRVPDHSSVDRPDRLLEAVAVGPCAAALLAWSITAPDVAPLWEACIAPQLAGSATPLEQTVVAQILPFLVTEVTSLLGQDDPRWTASTLQFDLAVTSDPPARGVDADSPDPPRGLTAARFDDGRRSVNVQAQPSPSPSVTGYELTAVGSSTGTTVQTLPYPSVIDLVHYCSAQVQYSLRAVTATGATSDPVEFTLQTPVTC